MQLIRILFFNLVVALGALVPATAPPPAAASPVKQISIVQDDHTLITDPAGTLATLRILGDQVVKVTVHWQSIAPNSNSARRPRGFRAVNPAAYPRRNWAMYDQIVRDAHADGIQVYFNLGGGAPAWAEGPRQPGRQNSHPGWEPSPGEFEAFVHAFGARYSGTYRPPGASSPLPRVSFWSVWNEPNFGYSLSPQGVPGNFSVENSPRLYRSLINAAWSGLQQTGHGRDTFLFGELGPIGGTSGSTWGEFQAMAPLVFLRALYCVDSRYRQLRGYAAAIRGCPTTAAGSRRFRGQNPVLFRASGVADHLWMRWYPPNQVWASPGSSVLSDVGQLVSALDRLQRAYGSGTRLLVYDTEFGYVTDPPNNSPLRQSGAPPTHYPSPTTAAYWLNWAEYMSWKNSRIGSFDNYLLRDPPPFSRSYEAWASGLLGWQLGVPKATYSAWRLPLYLPVTSARVGQSLEVWGCIRPATYALHDTGLAQTADIQFAPAGSPSFTTVQQVTVSSTSNCYFDVRLSFTSSGTVRLAYTYPSSDRLLPAGYTAYSRPVAITLR